MIFEFRWYCTNVAGVVQVQVASADRWEAERLAEMLVRDLALPEGKRFRWRPGAVVETDARV